MRRLAFVLLLCTTTPLSAGLHFGISSAVRDRLAQLRAQLTAAAIAPATAVPVNTNTVTPTFSVSPTFTFSPTITLTPTVTPTFTVSHTSSASPTLSATFTPSQTVTSSPTRSSSPTQSASFTASPSQTASATPTVSPSYTITSSPTRTRTNSFTMSATPSASPTQSPSFSPSPTASSTSAASATSTFTASLTPTSIFSGGGPTATAVPTLGTGSLTSLGIGFSGDVKSVVSDGTWVYAGGNFNKVGVPSGSGVVWDLSGNTLQTGWPQIVGGEVTSVIADNAGGWFVCGKFTNVAGQTRTGLAHIYANGSLDPSFNPVMGGTGGVQSMALAGNDLYVGGRFTSVNADSSRRNLVKLNTANGAIDAGFAGLLPGGSNPEVRTLVVDGGSLYLGGVFTTINGAARANLAKVDAITGVTDPSFTIAATAPLYTNALALQGSTLFIGGQPFSAHLALVAVDSVSGAVFSSFAPAVGTYVYSLAPSGANLFVGGDFATIGGQTRQTVAKVLTATGSAVVAFNANVPGSTTALSLAISGSKLYMAGSFTTINSFNRSYCAAVDTTTGALDSSFVPTTFDQNAKAIAVNGTQLFIGGTFKLVSVTARLGLARFDASTGALDSAFPTDNAGSVNALVLSGTDLYVGGSFSALSTTARFYIGKIDTTTRLVDAGFSVPGAGSGTVLAMAVSSTTDCIYIAPQVAGNPIRKYSTLTGTLDAGFNCTSDSSIYALSVSGTALYAGGSFTSLSGNGHARLGKVDALSGIADAAFGPDPSGTIVYAIALKGSDIYAAGDFTSISGTSRRYIAKLNDLGAVDTAFDANVSGSIACCLGSVQGLATTSARLLAAGNFTSAGGGTRNGIALLDLATGTADSSLTQGIDTSSGNWAISAGVYGNRAYVGGNFVSVGKANTPSLVGFQVAP